MLPASERLRRDNLFQRVYAGRKSVSSPLFTLYVLPRQPRSAPKAPLVGFVVGKKVDSKAAYRNRAKRRVREAYRQAKLEHPSVKQWYAMVWVVHNKILSASWDEILKAVSDCMTKTAERYGKQPGNSDSSGSAGSARSSSPRERTEG